MPRPWRREVRTRLVVAVAALGAASSVGSLAAAQPPSGDQSYLMGTQRLEIVVHIFGEVAHPGEYRVPDDTDVLELVSKAGGPTALANLGDVAVRHREGPVTAGGEMSSVIVPVDLTRFLEDENSPAPPVLRPGDVVEVPRNKMARWRTVFTMVRDLSVVVTAYLLYLRVN